MKKVSFAVIGGGIVGLTLGNGLYSRRIASHLFEKRDSIKTYPNYRISIDEMGINALQNILPVETFKKIKESSIMTDKTARYVNAKDLIDLNVIKPKEKAYVISSAKMMKILSANIPKDYISNSKSFFKLTESSYSKSIVSHFEDGSTIETDYIIGCDGVDSTVRKKITSDEITDVGFRYVEGYLDPSYSPKIDGLLECPIIAVGSTGYSLSVHQNEEENGRVTKWRLSFLDEAYQGKLERKSQSKDISIVKEFCLDNLANWHDYLVEIVNNTPLDQMKFPQKYRHHFPKKLTKKVILMGESLYSIFPFEFEPENYHFEDINQFIQQFKQVNIESLPNFIKNYSLSVQTRVNPKVYKYESSIEKIHATHLKCIIRNFSWSLQKKSHNKEQNNKGGSN